MSGLEMNTPSQAMADPLNERIRHKQASSRSALQRQTAMQMSNRMMTVGVIRARANHAEPETAITLKHQNRLRRTLAV